MRLSSAWHVTRRDAPTSSLADLALPSPACHYPRGSLSLSWRTDADAAPHGCSERVEVAAADETCPISTEG